MRVVLGSIYLKIVYSGLSEAEVTYITAKLSQSQKENTIVEKYILIYFFILQNYQNRHPLWPSR